MFWLGKWNCEITGAASLKILVDRQRAHVRNFWLYRGLITPINYFKTDGLKSSCAGHIPVSVKVCKIGCSQWYLWWTEGCNYKDIKF